ncbi:DJ-1/PfpI family protein [Methylobacterium sp. P1-11]|uniref:DJ-1/PfpI family protein n=1 Tax=Methylobacterium sp. P1-11 TaxID=2024616 RepID=UPI0011EC8C3A|nr:DJ-1/PfpI family protein [Methylobacterium sp. P1-11]KAA0121985.1 DJ-1/PfpI family protein [Methylobacterium sp. P1-11]
MRDRDAPARIGIIVYPGIEPIDLGGTVGVLSMARRILPNLADAVIAVEAGPVHMAGGLTVAVPFGVDNVPDCDVFIVCGGPGWPQASEDARLLTFLRGRRPETLASVCTGALILAAAGSLDGRSATTRRVAAGTEAVAPLDLLFARAAGVTTRVAAIVDDVVVTGGGVSLAIDTTLYLIGKLYGLDACQAVARLIEYDRALAANADALGIVAACSEL